MTKVQEIEKQLLSLAEDYPWFEDVCLRCRFGHVDLGTTLSHFVPMYQTEDPKETVLRLIALFQKSIDDARKEIEEATI